MNDETINNGASHKMKKKWNIAKYLTYTSFIYYANILINNIMNTSDPFRGIDIHTDFIITERNNEKENLRQKQVRFFPRLPVNPF